MDREFFRSAPQVPFVAKANSAEPLAPGHPVQTMRLQLYPEPTRIRLRDLNAYQQMQTIQMNSTAVARLMIRLSAVIMVIYAFVDGSHVNSQHRAGVCFRVSLNLLCALLFFGKTDRTIQYLAGGRQRDLNLGVVYVRLTSVWLLLSGVLDFSYFPEYFRAYHTLYGDPARAAATAENYYLFLARLALFIVAGLILFFKADRTIAMLVGAPDSSPTTVKF
jgi:hypothetical protein